MEYEKSYEAMELMEKWMTKIAKLESELKQLQELAQAKAEGRLVVLPVKVGDMVYHVTPTQQVEEILVDCIGVTGTLMTMDMAIIPVNDFGKTVFLTREEAVKAIGGPK